MDFIYDRDSRDLMTTPRIIDQATIATLRDLGTGDNGAFLREIVGIFLADTPLRLAELKESLAARDREKFIRSAHCLKGSSASVGAVALRASADSIEARARAEFGPDLGPVLAELTAEYERARIELQELA